MGDDTCQSDSQVEEVAATWVGADPSGARAATVFRTTFDLLYDGQHTGRFRWDQLYKTEKTHFGTLLEINLRRAFKDIIEDGRVLDYRISGHEVDCKYSQTLGGWMIPPEAHGHLLLVATANDERGLWSLGFVRASLEHLSMGRNRDGKTNLNRLGRGAIRWVAHNGPMPPNTLASLPSEILDAIFTPTSGQQRVNQLLRLVTNRRIGRNTIATVAQQNDYMKRVRSNGGARTALAAEGYLIPGGDYAFHQAVARSLGAEVPEQGEVVSLRVTTASAGDPATVELDGCLWRLARDEEMVHVAAPRLPETKRQPPIGLDPSN